VGVLDGGADGEEEAQEGGEVRLGGELGEGASVPAVEGVERPASEVADVVDAGDRRVVELGQDEGLPEEARLVRARRREPEPDRPPQPPVEGAGLPALGPERLEERVALADEDRGDGLRRPGRGGSAERRGGCRRRRRGPR